MIYNHIENCPVWNFWKVNETGDLRYLIKNEKIGVLPDVFNKKKLQKAFTELLDSNTYSDYAILKKFYKCKKALYFYLLYPKSSKRINDYNSAFIKYLREYDKHYSEYDFGGEIYSKLIDLYKLLHSEIDIPTLYRIRLDVFDPQKISGQKAKSWDLYRDIINLKEALKYDINIKEITIKEYYSLIDTVKERTEIQRVKSAQKIHS